MCYLNKISNRKSVIGYKVVAKHKKTGKYYSIFMGFKYPNPNKPIPIIKKQKLLINGFSSNILDKDSSLFKEKMQGRTAIFTSIISAKMALFSKIFSETYKKTYKKTYKNYSYPTIHSNYIPVIVKVKLSGNLMEGDYCGFNILAGNYMEFLKEIP